MNDSVLLVETSGEDLILAGQDGTTLLVDSPGDILLIGQGTSEALLFVDRGGKGDPGVVQSVFGRSMPFITAQSNDYSAFYQPLDGGLTTISGLTPTTGQFLVYGASAWESRGLLAADIPNFSASKITSGTIDDVRISSNITRDTEYQAADAVLQSAIDAIAAAMLTQSTADILYAPISHTQSWSTITSKPTTLSGFGITDGVAKLDQAFKARALSGHLETFRDAPTISGDNITQQIWRSVRGGDASTRLLTMDFFYSGDDLSSIELTDHRRLTAGDSDARIRKRYESNGEIWYEVIV